ncbi:hypothetical protein HZB90_04175 [archaeon]|nr:hypothetical protein [archaeon]
MKNLNVIETRLKFGTAGGNATRKDIIGLFKSRTTLVQNTSLSGIFFYYNSTNQTGWTTMNWTFVVCNNSRVVTSSSCQYLNTTTIANTTAWHTFRIQGNNAYNATATRNTAWTAIIDGVTVGTIGNNTIVPDGLTASTLGSWSESIDATADQTWFDYYYYELKR